MWFCRHSQLVTLEKRVSAAEEINAAQTRTLEKNQKSIFLVMAGVCLSLCLHFGLQSMQEEDKKFAYDFLRLMMGASGLTVAAKAGVLEVKSNSQSQTLTSHLDSYK
jgi:hypothetical protein